MANPDYQKLRFEEMDRLGQSLLQHSDCLDSLLADYKIFDVPDSNLSESLEQYALGYFKEKIGGEFKEINDIDEKKKKIGGKPLRAYFCKKIYEYLNQCPEVQHKLVKFNNPDELFTLKLPLIFEMVITVQYLHNQVLDQKYDTNYHKKVNDNLLSSNILRELIFIYLEEYVEPHLTNINDIRNLYKTLRRLLLTVDVGQRIDKNFSHYRKFEKGIPSLKDESFAIFDSITLKAISPWTEKIVNEIPEQRDFIYMYFQRIYLTNAHFFRCISNIIIDLIGYKGLEKKSIYLFSDRYGFMLQIINDVSDFAYSDNDDERKWSKTAGKKTTDILSDLRNKNITLPLIFHLSRGQGEKRKLESFLITRNVRNGKFLLSKYPMQMLNELLESGALSDCIQIARELSSAAKECLDEDNPMSPYLNNMCDIAKYNRFYKILGF